MKQAIAVRVPEGNMAHAAAHPIMRKIIFNFLIFAVMPKMRNATADEAMPIPKLAASLYHAELVESEKA